MPTPQDTSRSAIEMEMLEAEAKKLWPILTEEEKREKQKGYAVRIGTVLVREAKKLNEEIAEINREKPL